MWIPNWTHSRFLVQTHHPSFRVQAYPQGLEIKVSRKRALPRAISQNKRRKAQNPLIQWIKGKTDPKVVQFMEKCLRLWFRIVSESFWIQSVVFVCLFYLKKKIKQLEKELWYRKSNICSVCRLTKDKVFKLWEQLSDIVYHHNMWTFCNMIVWEEILTFVVNFIL